MNDLPLAWLQKLNRDPLLLSGFILHYGTCAKECVKTSSPDSEMPMGPNGLTTHHQNFR